MTEPWCVLLASREDPGRQQPSPSKRDPLTATLRRAAALLGRPFEIDGRVITGDKRGRELGFPTANLNITEYMRPAYGIYAIRALVDRPGDSTWIDGVANLGIRPMWLKTLVRMS